MSTSIQNQITNKITLPQDNGTSKVNIILQPENLGKVTVEIMQTKDGVAAKIAAETPQIKELLDKSIESLKNNIAAQGVNVNNITVKVEESASAQNSNLGFEQEQFNREASSQSNQERQTNQSQKKNTDTTTNTSPEILAQDEDINTSPTQGERIHEHNGSINLTV